ncbi:HNH endonuclease [Aliarcobacter butzleri]|uniref:HNH endonuclease n=1 Tax=Aliarcobacter butzleri TaxID=28197 RepID=UPI003AF8873A
MSEKEKLIEILHNTSDEAKIKKATKELNKISLQADSNIPNGITKEMILKASKLYDDKSLLHRFHDSRDFDVIINGKTYPPKAIIGIASKFITRILHPSEFSAGHDKKCFKVLVDLGFKIEEKHKLENEKRIKSLSSEELEKRIKQSQKESPEYTYSKTTIYQRSPYIVEYVLRRANGICELCEQKAPFCKPNGEAYLEVHHIIQLAKGGPDTISNTVALCPNCHRKMHSLNKKIDIKKLESKAKSFDVI